MWKLYLDIKKMNKETLQCTHPCKGDMSYLNTVLILTTNFGAKWFDIVLKQKSFVKYYNVLP